MRRLGTAQARGRCHIRHVKEIRLARVSICIFRRIARAARGPPWGCRRCAWSSRVALPRPLRKAERPLAARCVAKGRMQVLPERSSSQTSCKAPAGGSRSSQRTIAPTAVLGQGNSGHRLGRASGARKGDGSENTRRGVLGLLLIWRSGGWTHKGAKRRSGTARHWEVIGESWRAMTESGYDQAGGIC